MEKKGDGGVIYILSVFRGDGIIMSLGDRKLVSLTSSSSVSSDDKNEKCHFRISAHFFSRLLWLLTSNDMFRSSFREVHRKARALHFNLDEGPMSLPIDYESCRMAGVRLWKHIRVDDALNWLSTLGGAYSNLGEHSEQFAVMAGENAFRQMQLVLQSENLSPSVLFRCWLFSAMSAMQQSRLKDARRIVETVYRLSKGMAEASKDEKVEKMCLGVWSRLRYAWNHRKSI